MRIATRPPAASIAAPCVAMAVVLAAAGAAWALPPRPSPSGAGTAVPPPSREELMRRFDLDADGRIDPAEAEVARTRMRRERLDQLRRQGIDPITGRRRGEVEDEMRARKRGAAAEADEDPTSLSGSDEPDDLLPPARGRSNEPDRADASRRSGARKDRADAASGQRGGSPSAAAPASGPAGRAGERPGAATGGVRAGAPPARPGYGAPAAPKESKPLNAGRPVGSLLPGGASGGRPGARPGAPTAPGGSPQGSSRLPPTVRPGQPAPAR